MVNHITYDSFGNVTSETAAVDHLFGYTGRAYDEETDLQNNLNRWYDAASGKWLSEDPIGFAAGDANLYRYVGNSATNATDPSGEKVYWVVRDLDLYMFGNHGFILVVPDKPNELAGLQLLDMYNGKRGVTLGGYKGEEGVDGKNCGGKLTYRFNWKADVASVREAYDKKRYKKSKAKYKSGWDAELHEIPPPPGMSDTQFIRQLLLMARNYRAKGSNTPTYSFGGPNCQSWTFSMLLDSGVPKVILLREGEFHGFDWGEEEAIDEKYFRP